LAIILIRPLIGDGWHAIDVGDGGAGLAQCGIPTDIVESEHCHHDHYRKVHQAAETLEKESDQASWEDINTGGKEDSLDNHS